MDWERRWLEALRASRTAYDEPHDWRAVLALYAGLEPAEADALDHLALRMISEEYRNPYSSSENLPFDDVMVNLPAGMTPEDLLCVESAVMVAAERRLGAALFALNRLMRAPRWHALYPRLQWLPREQVRVQRTLAESRAGRALGAMLGLAAGDALGATLEFMSRDQVRSRFPGGHREMLGGGPFRWAPGQWTDDTAMALAVARGIAEAPDDPVEAVGRHFLDWYGANPPDVGNTVRMAMEAYRRTGSWEAASAEVARSLGSMAGGNGALMRTLPTAIAYGPETGPAIRIARMTHPHPESDAAVIAYHRMVDAILRGEATDRPAVLAVGLAHAGPLAERLNQVPRRTEGQIRASGYVVDTLEAALWAFLTTDSLEECLVRAVNLGDDADTAGAVAGGLAGAWYGPGAVPRRWSTALRHRGDLEAAAAALLAVSAEPGL